MVTDRERELLSWIEENPMMSQQELADRAGITRSSVSVHISNLMKKGMIQGKGYVVQKRPYAVVVGGVNMDIAGYASGEVVPHDSNPGRVEHTAGGVGRNEAHGMRLLGLDVKLVTAFGDDLYAEKLRQNCRDLGIDVKDAITVVNAATSTYLSVVDHRGDPVVGISSMDIYEHLTPALLAQRMGVINRAHTCVVDTNLTEDALRFLADNCRVPLFAETISVAKAHKLRGILDRIDTLKADRLEVQLLLGREPDEKADVEVTARQLLDRGVRHVYITLSSGAYCADETGAWRLPGYPAEVVNKTGARDSFMAALVWARMRGMDLRESACAGLAAAGICTAGEPVVNEELSEQYMLEVMQGTRKITASKTRYFL
ncbi:PfkB family carbohydrate kinase [Anaerotruncus massiliensis (ex Togo et al. 2019)]|jgi:hypothetical protein|uniref:Winged helix-turn-helix transcriptional regulator n=3 Tax=Anaerotruncus TaxID=244127 RepID=A0A498CTA9_9FIRM|nr:PfkB family carbohydrate kinase [Anaerotruncus massiliensis (ex Togo et al. 2019)]MBC3938036.1 winged helix-turn-helix transcriptional regulator [Anaerotruncus massiliensis (ex Togo et al. 2019)]RLL13605.1 winged helix-turn-helix transcriptional regulator [Anaerotruncus massiliensis (ex Liu et al. 2021)]GKH47254.1 carbohydrate kinase [Oscillospiraceae bacterium]